MLKGYAPVQYKGFEPEFDDGYVTALGLSVANGIERAGNLTMLYAETAAKGFKYLQKMNAMYEAENAPEIVRRDIPKNLEELYEQELEEYDVMINKRKENQLKLESMVDQIADVHKLGTVGRLTTSFAASMVESLNPVEMAVDYISGGVAGKIVGSAAKTGILGRSLRSNAFKTMAEVGIVGALGGSFDGMTRMYITEDYSLDNFFKSSLYGSMSAVGFYGIGRFAKRFGKIRTEEDLKAFGKAIRGDVDVDPKIKRKADQFVSAVQEVKNTIPNSNYEQVMETMDKIIDTHFLIGKKVAKEDVLDMLNLPKHSGEFDAAQQILSLGDNAVRLRDYEINRATQISIATEINDIMTDLNTVKGLETLGKKRAELEAMSMRKKKMNKKQKEKYVRLAEEVSDLENNLDIKKVKELQRQLEELKVESVNIKTDINSKLDNYDVDSFLAERYKYDEEFMTVNVDGVARKLGEDVEHQSVRTNEYEVEDTKAKREEVENNFDRKEIDTDNVILKENATEFKDIDTDWTNNIDDKASLIRSWVEQGCEL